ncbi:alpha-amylase family protein [Georgenia ruanii]|uniref:hypothetical protein n=1 Tax=Georgenia ruanii TaxID=348442 RepID=UPI001D0034CC|nr:hypothetical protein [Georgenia ruanii]
MTDHETTAQAAPGEQPRGDQRTPALGDVTTTTVVHRSTRRPTSWWQHAVVLQVRGETDLPGLEALAAEISHVARLGADAIEVHCPGLDPGAEPARGVVEEFVRRAHQRGIKVLVALAGTDAPPQTDAAAWHLARCTAWLHRGIDGIDLISASRPVPPLGPHAHAGIELGALHALIAEHGEDVILTGGGTARDRAALASHLHEDWLHITRDDRLVVTPWRPEPLRATITDAYALRDPVGAPAGWTLATAALAAPAEWGDLAHAALRRRHDAAAALMLALPGTAYLHLGEAVGVRQDGDVAAAVRATAAAVAAQKGRPDTGFERYRRGLRLRDELRLGTGPVGWVDSPAGTLAFLNREVLVLVNLGPGTVVVPAEREILHASADLPAPAGGEVSVPADTTVWLAVS